MEFSRVQKNDAQIERLKSNMRLKEKKAGRSSSSEIQPPQLMVCVSLNGSMVDASCLYYRVGSVDGAASARPVLRAPGFSKPNRVMGKLQGKAARLASERKQTAVVAGMGDNYL